MSRDQPSRSWQASGDESLRWNTCEKVSVRFRGQAKLQVVTWSRTCRIVISNPKGTRGGRSSYEWRRPWNAWEIWMSSVEELFQCKEIRKMWTWVGSGVVNSYCCIDVYHGIATLKGNWHVYLPCHYRISHELVLFFYLCCSEGEDDKVILGWEPSYPFPSSRRPYLYVPTKKVYPPQN